MSRPDQCDQIKSPNVYKSCPTIISLEKWMILAPLQKLPNNVGKIIVATGFELLPRVQKSPNLITLVLMKAQIWMSQTLSDKFFHNVCFFKIGQSKTLFVYFRYLHNLVPKQQWFVQSGFEPRTTEWSCTDGSTRYSITAPPKLVSFKQLLSPCIIKVYVVLNDAIGFGSRLKVKAIVGFDGSAKDYLCCQQ